MRRGMLSGFGRLFKTSKSVEMCFTPKHMGLVNRRASCGKKRIFPYTLAVNACVTTEGHSSEGLHFCSVGFSGLNIIRSSLSRFAPSPSKL